MKRFFFGMLKKKIPTNMERATGPERLQMIQKLTNTEPKKIYYQATKPTVREPLVIESLGAHWRAVGCHGYGDDEHPLLWLRVEKGQIFRCPECGAAYTLDEKAGTMEEHH